MIINTEWLLNNFGRIAWFEEKLGTEGGSRLGYKLIGIIALFLGIILMTGSGNAFMQWLLSPLLQYSQPK
jgi:cytochrome b